MLVYSTYVLDNEMPPNIYYIHIYLTKDIRVLNNRIGLTAAREKQQTTQDMLTKSIHFQKGHFELILNRGPTRSTLFSY